MFSAFSGRSMLARILLIGLIGFILGAVGAGQTRADQTQESKAMLAVVGLDGNLSVYDSAGLNPIRVTSDAVPNQRVYQWPTWSTDGRLAFFGASADPSNSYSLGVFVAESVPGPVKLAYSSTDEVFAYAYWSPANCAAGCRELSVLYNLADQSSLGVRLIRDMGGQFSTKMIGTGAPFYFSFAPDGKRMLWARFSKQIELYDVEADQTHKLLDKPGKFNAPMWSPVSGDERLLFGVPSLNPDQTDVLIAQGDERRVLLRDQDGPVSFAWSPDARFVASVTGFDKVVVTDVQSGKAVATSQQSNVVAHFWSPGSDRVGFLVVNREGTGAAARLRANGHTPAEQATGGLTWYVLDVKTGKSDAMATFSPTRDMVYLLNFFDQFARSHQLWSPDGRYLTYGAVDQSGSPAVYIVDTRQPTSPVKVGPGTLGIWNWQ